ncbi:MAG: tRNA (adenosine(37)-N6)-threonylcarbamoyltransferase complex dimerization subunit type 1 TsaB [Isosphaeraceae bacterium]
MDERTFLLAMDTSTPHAALALCPAEGPPCTASADPAERHGRALVPAVRDLLRTAGLVPGELDGIVVGTGPGSYTGLRIGVTVAKAFAYALGKPLATFDSLEVMARNAPPEALCVSVISDAQRGDLYVADFRRDAPGGNLLQVSPTRVEPLASWAAALPEGVCVLGPALAVPRIAPGIPAHAVVPPDDSAHRPDPRAVATLAREVWRTGFRVDPFFLEPLYLRRSSAEEQWDRKTQA